MPAPVWYTVCAMSTYGRKDYFLNDVAGFGLNMDAVMPDRTPWKTPEEALKAFHSKRWPGVAAETARVFGKVDL